MPGEYVTETERVRKRLRETLTPREKLANWWDYNRRYVFIGAAALLILAYFAVQTAREPPADYSVAWVSGEELDRDTEREIAGRLARFGEDLNGDGTVRVELHRVAIDLRAVIERGGVEGEKEQANLMALEADLNVFQSGVFITDDPEALQEYTGALLALDGTPPEGSGTSVAWSRCPWLGELPVDRELYLAVRGCWDREQTEKWTRSMEFFNALRTGNS